MAATPENARDASPAARPNPNAPAAAPWGRPDAFETIAPGVGRLEIGFVNVYAINEPGETGSGPWILVDTGLPKAAPAVRRAARKRFGARPPEAIVLTHGHFDHAGNAEALAAAWDVPVYAHAAELPFLNGTSDYPPQDPTPGGAICFLSRFFPREGINLRGRLQMLPEDEHVPGVGGWRWVHTPGHTPGHVSLFREEGARVLLAGDAVATMDLDSWATQVTHAQQLSRPPTPFTPDWRSARTSLGRIAELEPGVVGAGHGPPATGPETAAQLRQFVEHGFRPPRQGRYVNDPVEADPQHGITHVPPPVDDPLPHRLGAGAAALGGLALGATLARWRNRPY